MLNVATEEREWALCRWFIDFSPFRRLMTIRRHKRRSRGEPKRAEIGIYMNRESPADRIERNDRWLADYCFGDDLQTFMNKAESGLCFGQCSLHGSVYMRSRTCQTGEQLCANFIERRVFLLTVVDWPQLSPAESIDQKQRDVGVLRDFTAEKFTQTKGRDVRWFKRKH